MELYLDKMGIYSYNRKYRKDGMHMEKQIVRIKRLDKNAVIPTYGSPFAAGADIYALLEEEKITLLPGETKRIHTGFAMEIPEGYAGFIYARSGIATKRGLVPANCVGVVDSDYRGEVLVALHNHSEKVQEIANGERIAQMVIAPFLAAEFQEEETLLDTERGEGGFGSTGRK